MPPEPFFDGGDQTAELKAWEVGDDEIYFEIVERDDDNLVVRNAAATLPWGHVEILRDELTRWLTN